MALTTFGAIMGFAGEMLRRTGDVYKAAAQKARNPALRETLQALLTDEGKNQSLMEKTRRENVTEMILEPISGLRQEDYETDIHVGDEIDDAGLLKVALTCEAMERKFFSEVSAKIPLPEVARIFRKMVQQKESNIARLKSLESIKA
jgi:rubrerythrin